ncbi:MAG: LemA family protein [Tolumonas sp.]|nr:MAG: LemA family protein [Tolumonas sp.]
MTGFLVVLGLLLLIIFWMVSIYNQLVTLKGRYQNGFAQIEVQLKRRYDLIPNLVETAKGYMQHESKTLSAVTEARNAALAGLKAATAAPGNSAAMQQLATAEQQLHGALQGLNVQIEAYPELKANENMLQLSEELTATENRVAFARQGFNDCVTAYNIYRNQFPNSVVANRFGHTADASLLEIEYPQEYRQAPVVRF